MDADRVDSGNGAFQAGSVAQPWLYPDGANACDTL